MCSAIEWVHWSNLLYLSSSASSVMLAALSSMIVADDAGMVSGSSDFGYIASHGIDHSWSTPTCSLVSAGARIAGPARWTLLGWCGGWCCWCCAQASASRHSDELFRFCVKSRSRARAVRAQQDLEERFHCCEIVSYSVREIYTVI